eukprot:Gregarina_sp_Poly_1__5130@NODE_2715_length_1792_cov_150_627826_g1244_i1_p1_GENE_NODE_2715_length_1792_cov_150_627826_g1244_i1NODE_2715_length_1792_cov_150_627826_g1244_i1_p1_ORF_typecomplete_len379_score47_70N2227/PF07942_12/0_0018_NODE_2715_length_1792_cov_150_627826_g1244_i16071743
MNGSPGGTQDKFGGKEEILEPTRITSRPATSNPVPNSNEHPALLQHPQFQALYRQLLLSLNQHGWRDAASPQPTSPERLSGGIDGSFIAPDSRPSFLVPPPSAPPPETGFFGIPQRLPNTYPGRPGDAWGPNPALEQLPPIAPQLCHPVPLSYPGVLQQQPPPHIPPLARCRDENLLPVTASITNNKRICSDDENLKSEDDNATSGKSDVDPQAESKHFREVCHAFATYEQMAMVEVGRMERHLLNLSPAEQSLLMEPVDSRIAKIKDSVATNQRFLNLLISQELDLIDDETAHSRSSADGASLQGLLSEFHRNQPLLKEDESGSSEFQCCDPIEPGCAIEDCEVSSMNMYKVRSTLKQFAREWSAEVSGCLKSSTIC